MTRVTTALRRACERIATAEQADKALAAEARKLARRVKGNGKGWQEGKDVLYQAACKAGVTVRKASSILAREAPPESESSAAESKLGGNGSAPPLSDQEMQFELDLVAHIKMADLARAQNRKALAEKYGITIKEVDEALKRRQRLRPNAPEPGSEAADIDELAEAASEIIAAPDVLELFAKDWKKVIAGEERLGKVAFVVGTSRLFVQPMSIALKGPSSGGKSAARRAVLNFFPPEDVITFTATSERALLFDDRSFEHKILSMAEAVNDDEATLQNLFLRELISEGRLEYKTVQKVGDRYEPVTIEKEGPVSFWVTTTANLLHPENETRLLSLEIDDSNEQTGRVLLKVAEAYAKKKPATVDYGRWHAYQRWLAAGPTEVVVPFVEIIAKNIPTKSVRLRRDFTQLMDALTAHALMHREHREKDKAGRLIAQIDPDYKVVRDLLGDLLAESSGVKLRGRSRRR